jgi:hypothetical protein
LCGILLTAYKKTLYEKNIENRNGAILVIEQRMLNSISECVELSGLSEQDINSAKKFPDFASMCTILNFSDIFYTAIQRMGSHAVHGTWSDLVFNYLRHENGQRLYPRDHEIETQDVQFIVVIRLVLCAMKYFLNYVVSDFSEMSEFISAIDSIDEKMVEIQRLAWASDFGTTS